MISSPHLVRYLSAALLLSPNYRKFGNFKMMDLVKILERGNLKYEDNFTLLIKSILLEFDFK